jgi:hypothetical protein
MTAESVCPQANHFTIGRIPIQVTSDSPRLLGPIQEVLRPRAGAGGQAPFHLFARYGSEPSGWQEEAPTLFWSGLLRGSIPSEYYTAVGHRVVCVPGRAWGRLDFEQRRLEIVCRPGQEGCVTDGCLIPLLCELLAHQGHFVIHSASLAFRWQGEMAGILLAGVSGAGKTTTALALAHAGMVLLADDMSFIESPGPDGCVAAVPSASCRAGRAAAFLSGAALESRAGCPRHEPATPRVGLWGLQLTCKVHDNTRRLLPWLDACPAKAARVEGETCMDVTNVVGESTGVMADPRLLLLLGPRSKGDHVLLPLDKTQAMMRLTSENIRAYEHRAEGSAGNAFRALGQLVAQCQVYRLCVGEPLSSLADRIRSLLGSPA